MFIEHVAGHQTSLWCPQKTSQRRNKSSRKSKTSEEIKEVTKGHLGKMEGRYTNTSVMGRMVRRMRCAEGNSHFFLFTEILMY